MSHMQKMFERDWSPELIEKYADGRYKRTVVNAAWVQWQIAWAAGRESMRQEIIPLVYGMCESDNVAARTVDAIRKIEA